MPMIRVTNRLIMKLIRKELWLKCDAAITPINDQVSVNYGGATVWKTEWLQVRNQVCNFVCHHQVSTPVCNEVNYENT